MSSEEIMESNIAIELKSVSKIYNLYKNEKEKFLSLFTDMSLKKHTTLQDVSLKIFKGEVVGVLGKNGAGKSTLLKIITGVTYPTSGEVIVNGRVGALLELTAGFIAEMTGRENIYLKTAILGMSKEETLEIEDSIIEFADLGEYIDQPIRTYSSGMKARLGFSINVNIEPEILIIDEALSVGDVEFRKKCKEKVLELIDKKITVLFVSHNKGAVDEICTRVIALKGGKISDV